MTVTFNPEIAAVDWARLAAFIDGEGCLAVQKNKPVQQKRSMWYYPRLLIYNTDVRLMDWLVSVFGGKARQDKKGNATHKPSWVWELVSEHRLLWILDGIRPYLILKGEQADLMISFYRDALWTFKPGLLISPEELIRRDALHEQSKALNKRGPDAN